MSIFSKFAHWNDYTEEAQRETLKDVDRWLEDYDRLKVLTYAIGRHSKEEIPADVYYAWQAPEDYEQMQLKLQGEKISNLLEACKYALRIFEKYKNHPQMEPVREELRKVIKESEVV